RMDDASSEAMRARIKELENEIRTLKGVSNQHQTNQQSISQIGAETHSELHEFTIEQGSQVKLSELVFASMDGGLSYRIRIDRQKGSDDHFFCTLLLKKYGEERKIAITTMEVMELRQDDSRSHLSTTSQRFVLGRSFTREGREEEGHKTPVVTTDKQKRPTFFVKFTISIEKLTQMSHGEDPTIVIVGQEEFIVSTHYLCLWSHYFRHFFQTHQVIARRMTKLPLEDEDITPTDFEELLLVINHTDKPITEFNYSMLIKMADKFEMPELKRRIESFLVDFERNGLNRARVFREATDIYHLENVKSTLLHRWREGSLMKEELLMTDEYEKLKDETKTMINGRYVRAISYRGEIPTPIVPSYAVFWEIRRPDNRPELNDDVAGSSIDHSEDRENDEMRIGSVEMEVFDGEDHQSPREEEEVLESTEEDEECEIIEQGSAQRGKRKSLGAFVMNSSKKRRDEAVPHE
ncbi:hypothetical protein PENTCL1PPCAC_29870, partial [Pristionchus entomophagus]